MLEVVRVRMSRNQKKNEMVLKNLDQKKILASVLTVLCGHFSVLLLLDSSRHQLWAVHRLWDRFRAQGWAQWLVPCWRRPGQVSCVFIKMWSFYSFKHAQHTSLTWFQLFWLFWSEDLDFVFDLLNNWLTWRERERGARPQRDGRRRPGPGRGRGGTGGRGRGGRGGYNNSSGKIHCWRI